MKTPSVISFNYTLRNGEGELIESTEGKPVSIIEGRNGLLHRVESALMGASVGERCQVVVPAAEGYGDYDSSLIIEIARADLPADTKQGDTVYAETEDGETVELKVLRFNEDSVVLDGNHPLAGVELNFELEVTRKRLATMNELNSGELSKNV